MMDNSTNMFVETVRKTVEPGEEMDDPQRGFNDSPFKLYLQEIRRIPLLTAEEEVALGKRVQQGLSRIKAAAASLANPDLTKEQAIGLSKKAAAGGHAATVSSWLTNSHLPSEIRDHFEAMVAKDKATVNRTEEKLINPYLSPEEKTELEKEVESGEQYTRVAVNQLMEANLRLVASETRKYYQWGIPPSDLIQEGNLGLNRACLKFDPHRGFRFSTYATYWINQSIQRSIANHLSLIRLPVQLFDVFHQLPQVLHNLEIKNGRPPTLKEIAQATGLNKEITLALLQYQPKPLSLDMHPPGMDTPESSSFEDIIADPNTISPEQLLFANNLPEEVENLLRLLPPKFADLLRMRHGLGSQGAGKTLQEIGKATNVTKERVRQIEAEAIKFARPLAHKLSLHELPLTD